MEIFWLFQLKVDKFIKDLKNNVIKTVHFNLKVEKCNDIPICKIYPVCDSQLAATNGATSCQ